MPSLSRREFLPLALAASAGLATAAEEQATVHEQLLDIAKRQEERRRARFAAVRTRADLVTLQKSLRETFLRLLGGLPEKAGPPLVKKTGRIDAGEYVIEKLTYESFPGYFVPALLYRPKEIASLLPGILSPCGHSHDGKASPTYQTLHANLAQARPCCSHLRPGRPRRTQPVLGCGQGEIALQPRLRRARGPRQPALPARHQPGSLPHLGWDVRHRHSDLAEGG